MTVGFFILRLEYTNDLTVPVPDKVATTGALVNPFREDTFIYCTFCLGNGDFVTNEKLRHARGSGTS